MTRLARRVWLILGMQMLTYFVGLIYLDARFDAGLAPLPFLATAYVFGLIIGLASRLLVGSAIPFRLALLAGIISLLEVVVSDSRFAFWLGLIPSIGAIAITLPLSRRPAIVDAT